MKQQTKSNTIAAVGTALFMAALFLILWFIYLSIPQIQEDEGIEVTFGDEMEMETSAGGSSSAAPSVSEPLPQEDEPEPASEEPQVTQDDESPAQVTPKETEQPKPDDSAEKKKKEQQEQQQKKDKAKAWEGLISGDSDSNGDSETGDSDSDNKNPLAGKGSGTDSYGNGWSLDGRDIVGALPRPDNTFKQDGKVVVNVIVDKNGDVVSATVGKGTTVSDEATRQLAVKAAKRAKFNMVNRPDKAMGTITYIFKYR